MLRLFSILTLYLLSLSCFAAADDINRDTDSTFSTLVEQLPATKLNKMAALIEKIAATSAPQKRDLLSSLLNGDLYYLKASKQVVIANKNNQKGYDLTDILHNTDLGAVKKSQIRKLRTNNRLRGQIRDLLAQIDLTHNDKNIRLEAVKQLLSKPGQQAITSLQKLVEIEQDPDVREKMAVVLAVNQLETGDPAEKLAATLTLKGNLEPVVKNAMERQLQALSPETPNPELKKALTDAIGKIEQSRTIYQFVENLFFGLSLGSVLLLAAIGLAITFGVMGVINMAHGEMMMLGAYTTYVIQQSFPNLIEYSLLMAIPAAFIVSGLVGVLIERGVIRFLKGRPLETLLATFGISLILQQLVRTIFSPLNRQVAAPQWMTGSLEINPIFSLTYNRLYIILFSLMVFFALLVILKKSALGLHVRAVSQNRDMARSLSIKSSWVDAITFGLGSGIAGIAGVVLSQLTNVGPNLGQAYIIDSFLVVVFGGVGNLWGTLVAALSLGAFNKLLEPSMGPVLANIIVLVGLVLFIQKRPKGLFPQKGRAAE
ncbi:urea ABC transporter permease subunit UrtB [Psychromonas sp.]|uniref:urea ABC transporter permease subunit UrtB n=1 Tax=Psychromonas sp. TaxID=1884585 RepID=UPI0035613112